MVSAQGFVFFLHEKWIPRWLPGGLPGGGCGHGGSSQVFKLRKLECDIVYSRASIKVLQIWFHYFFSTQGKQKEKWRQDKEFRLHHVTAVETRSTISETCLANL